MRDTPPFPADAPRFGDGRFVILSRIGRGRTGVVYRGYDVEPGEWRAFKLLDAELAADWEAWDRFVGDGLLLSRTVHPNLVRVHEVIGGRAPFLVMDLVTGGTLQRWIDRYGPMPPRLACASVLDVAWGVAAIHASGGVHGAIGPGNVLVDSHGVRLLSDLSASEDPEDFDVDVAALGDLLRRLCANDLPPRVAVVAAGCGVGSLRSAADVADAVRQVIDGLPPDPPELADPVLTTTGGERPVRTALLPKELSWLVRDRTPVSLLADGARPRDDTTTTDTLRFGGAVPRTRRPSRWRRTSRSRWPAPPTAR
ncbi:MAG: protein kinase [Myxococcota bacterium]